MNTIKIHHVFIYHPEFDELAYLLPNGFLIVNHSRGNELLFFSNLNELEDYAGSKVGIEIITKRFTWTKDYLRELIDYYYDNFKTDDEEVDSINKLLDEYRSEENWKYYLNWT